MSAFIANVGCGMAQDRLVEAYLAEIQASIKAPIPDEHLERVRKGIADKLKQAATLREVKLQNGDEPYSIFRAYREGSSS